MGRFTQTGGVLPHLTQPIDLRSNLMTCPRKNLSGPTIYLDFFISICFSCGDNWGHPAECANTGTLDLKWLVVTSYLTWVKNGLCKLNLILFWGGPFQCFFHRLSIPLSLRIRGRSFDPPPWRRWLGPPTGVRIDRLSGHSNSCTHICTCIAKYQQ